jgi:outer membrane protein insertion porin family
VSDDERYLESLYNRKGYIYARISRDYYPETRTLTYKISEGIQAKFGEFYFDGGGQVKLHVLQREFENLGLVEGAVFNEERLLAESRRRLLTAGLFKEVEIKASDYIENTEIIDVNVGVVVKKPGAISVSGGYISSEGIRGTLGVAHNNLFKRNMKISGKVSKGTRGNLYEITLIEPWFKLAPLDKLIGPTIGTFRLFNDNLEEYEDIRARGGTANLAKRLGQFGNLALQYKSQDLRDRDDPPKIQTTVSSLGIEFHRDSRDHFLNPKKGWFNEAAIEYAGGFLKGKTSFFKVTTDHRYYWQFGGDNVLASAVRLGFEKGLRGNREREIISFERFYAGGSNTVRGYPERGLGPEDEFGNHRGDVLFILNTELRFPIYRFIGGALFLDTGNVWNKFSDIKDVLPRVAMGSGVRLDTPLGPARVDIGVQLMREFKPLFYLQLGQAF